MYPRLPHGRARLYVLKGWAFYRRLRNGNERLVQLSLALYRSPICPKHPPLEYDAEDDSGPVLNSDGEDSSDDLW